MERGMKRCAIILQTGLPNTNNTGRRNTHAYTQHEKLMREPEEREEPFSADNEGVRAMNLLKEKNRKITGINLLGNWRTSEGKLEISPDPMFGSDLPISKAAAKAYAQIKAPPQSPPNFLPPPPPHTHTPRTPSVPISARYRYEKGVSALKASAFSIIHAGAHVNDRHIDDPGKKEYLPMVMQVFPPPFPDPPSPPFGRTIVTPIFAPPFPFCDATIHSSRRPCGRPSLWLSRKSLLLALTWCSVCLSAACVCCGGGGLHGCESVWHTHHTHSLRLAVRRVAEASAIGSNLCGVLAVEASFLREQRSTLRQVLHRWGEFHKVTPFPSSQAHPTGALSLLYKLC